MKGSKETVLKPASRKTANQQTTFKDFTQKFQPNVQGPRKPNLTKGEISKRELEARMDRGYRQSIKDLPADVKFDLANKVLRDIRRSVSEAVVKVSPSMKTYKEFINEALARMFVKTVAKQVFKNRGVAKAARNVINQSTNAPKQLKFTKLYHGTNTPASAAISKGGYRTDKNVTRQMLGKGVYTSPDNYSAAGYGIRASRKYGGEPAIRQLRVPQQIAKKQTTFMRQGTGDYSGKGYKMTTLSTQQANKYDVTDKLPRDKFDVKGPFMSPEKKTELRRRVRRGLKQRAGREELSIDIAKDKKNFGVQIYKDRINNAKRLKNMLRIEGYKDPRKRELKAKGQEIIRNQEMYDKITTPVRALKLKKA